MKIETMQEAGSHKWGIMVDGMLDTRSLGYAHEDGAINYAHAKYPGQTVIDSESPEHYNNR